LLYILKTHKNFLEKFKLIQGSRTEIDFCKVLEIEVPDVPENTKLQWNGQYYKKNPITDETKEKLVQEIKNKIGEKRP